MAQTFDTSRVGGGTYELEQDASGNYKLKSVGFAQVNKLNLPDLATSDTSKAKILPVEEKKKIEVADPFKKLSAQNTGGGEGGGQDYSGVMLKTPEVKDAEVRSAAEPMTKERLTESFAGEEKPTQTYAEQLANIQRSQMTDNNIGFDTTQYRSDSAKFKERFDPKKIQEASPQTTGLQDVVTKGKSAVANTVSKILDNSLTVKVIKGIGTALSSIAPK